MSVEDACDMESSSEVSGRPCGPWQRCLQAPSIARPPDVLAAVQTLYLAPGPRWYILLPGTPTPSGTPASFGYARLFEFTYVFRIQLARPRPPCRSDGYLAGENRHVDLYCRERFRNPIASITLSRVMSAKEANRY
jgi:hypothetical protein